MKRGENLEENSILILIIPMYIIFSIVGRKVFHIDKIILTSALNTIGAIFIIIHLIVSRTVLDSYILLIALSVIIIGSIWRIYVHKSNIEE